MMKTLTDILYQYHDKKIDWGHFDCCIFTAKVVEEYTQKELPIWRDLITYTSYKSALRTLKKNGINSVEDLPTAILGTEKLPALLAETGDPVYTENEKGEGILGICNGVRAYFLYPEKGLTAIELKHCMYCWSINK